MGGEKYVIAQEMKLKVLIVVENSASVGLNRVHDMVTEKQDGVINDKNLTMKFTKKFFLLVWIIYYLINYLIDVES